MRRLTHLTAGLVSLMAIFLAVSAPLAPVLAQTASGQALEIAPPVINIAANPGQTVKTQIFLRNISRTNLVVSGEANDFVAAGEDGTPKVILNNDTNNPYSMKTWIQPPANLTLVPKEIKTMLVTIAIPASASPGGHYGVIRFTARAPSLSGQGVALSASLGSLILMTVNGKVTENLSLASFSVSHNGKTGSLFQSGPLNFLERIRNTGNVHEQPAGQVTITDMFGRKVAAVNVNLPPKNILPNSIRKFEEPLDSTVIGNKKLFGRYTAKLSVTYGKDKKVLTSSLAFWVIPFKTIGIIIIILILGFFGLRYAIKRYNRYIIGRSGRR